MRVMICLLLLTGLDAACPLLQSSGTDVERLRHAMMALSTGDTSEWAALPDALLARPLQAFADPRTGMQHHWRADLNALLAAADAELQQWIQDDLTQRWQRSELLQQQPSLFGSVPAAASSLQQRLHIAFDRGDLATFLAWQQWLDDPQPHSHSKQATQVLTGLPDTVLPGPLRLVPAQPAPKQLAFWCQNDGYLLALAPDGRALWQWRLPARHQVWWNAQLAVVQVDRQLTIWQHDGSKRQQTMPRDCAILGLQGDTVWFWKAGAIAWRNGSWLPAIPLPSRPLAAPLPFQNGDRLWLGQRQIWREREGVVVAHYRHGLQLTGPLQWQIRGGRAVLQQGDRQWVCEALDPDQPLQAVRAGHWQWQDDASPAVLREWALGAPLDKLDAVLTPLLAALQHPAERLQTLHRLARPHYQTDTGIPGPLSSLLLPALSETPDILLPMGADDDPFADPADWQHLVRTSRLAQVLSSAAPRVPEAALAAVRQGASPILPASESLAENAYPDHFEIRRSRQSGTTVLTLRLLRDQQLLWRQQISLPGLIAEHDLRRGPGHVLLLAGHLQGLIFDVGLGSLQRRIDLTGLPTFAEYWHLAPDGSAVACWSAADACQVVWVGPKQRTHHQCPYQVEWCLPLSVDTILIKHPDAIRLHPGGQEVTWPANIDPLPSWHPRGLVIDGALHPWRR